MAQADNIIPFPRQKFLFRADDFQGISLDKRYETNRFMVAVCQSVLECTPDQLRDRLDQMRGQQDARTDDVDRLITDFEGCADACEDFARLFKGASARLNAVRHRMV